MVEHKQASNPLVSVFFVFEIPQCAVSSSARNVSTQKMPVRQAVLLHLHTFLLAVGFDAA